MPLQNKTVHDAPDDDDIIIINYCYCYYYCSFMYVFIVCLFVFNHIPASVAIFMARNIMAELYQVLLKTPKLYVA